MKRFRKDSPPPSADRFIGILLILGSAAAFGAMPIFASVAYRSGVDPTSLLFFRFTGAAGIMLIWQLAHRTPFPKGRSLLTLFLMGAIGYAGQSFSYFTALTLAPAGTVAILLYLYPALVTVLSVLLLHRRVSAVEIVALTLALTGTVCLVGLEPLGGRPLGIALGILAACIYAGYIIAGTTVTRSTDAFTAASFIMLSASLVYSLALALRGGGRFPETGAGWAAMGALTLVSTVLAITAFFAGLKRIGPVHASMLSTVEPLVTVFLAAVLLEESITLSRLVGGILVLGAAVMLTRGTHPAPDPVTSA